MAYRPQPLNPTSIDDLGKKFAQFGGSDNPAAAEWKTACMRYLKDKTLEALGISLAGAREDEKAIDTAYEKLVVHGIIKANDVPDSKSNDYEALQQRAKINALMAKNEVQLRDRAATGR